MKISTLSLLWTSTLCTVLVYTQMLPDETNDVVEGENIRLPCRFNPSFATRSIQYYWKHSNRNGTDVVAIKEVSFNAEHYSVEFVPQEGRYDLVITRAEYEMDNGKFECKLKEGGSGNDIFVQAFLVTVLIPPGPPVVMPNNPTAREEEPFDLTCSSQGGSPDPVIQWYRQGILVHGQVTNSESRDKPTTNVLTINPGMDDDGATYRCTVWNRAIREEQRMMATVKLTVHYAPRVTVGLYNPLNVLTDQDAHLMCSAVANPPVRSIRWMKDGQLLSTSPNHTIPAVTHEDSGQYVCSVDNGFGLTSEAKLELSVLYGPKVTVEPLREVILGESLTVTCKVDSNPTPHSIQWLKVDDAFFRQTGDILRLNRVTIHDTGKYACKATNMLRPSGSITQKEMSGSGIVQIVIKHKPGVATIFPVNPVATSGTPFTLSCVANPEGWPQPEFRWWRAGQENVVLGRTVNYTILPVHISHEGEYFCQAENSLGRGVPSSVYLTVQEPPSVLLSLRPQVVKEDGDEGFSITCKARGKPKPLVRWLRNGKEITDNSEFFRVDTTSHLEDNDAFSVQSTLYFDGPQKRDTSLSPSDRGRYSCVFENGVGEPARSEMNLRIKHSPIVRHTYNRVAFDVSETAILQCKMQAYPLPSFEWFYKGRIVDNYGSYSTNVTDLGDDVYVGILSIKDIRTSDFGDYTCRAWNQVGDDEKTIIKLVTKSAPDRPSMLDVVDISFDRVTLQWSEGFNGGFSNTEFLVNYINLETMQTKNESCRSHNPCQITGLQSKTEYNFKVMAVNPRGYSSYSDEISVTTKVNIKDMPRATDAQFNRETYSLSFIVDSKMLKLVAKVEARVKETDKWQQQALLEVEQKNTVVYLKPPQEGFSDVRVILCLQSNESWCGDEKLAEPFIEGTAQAIGNSPPLSTRNIIIIVAVSASIFILVAIIIIVFCCCSKKIAKSVQKNNKMETGSARSPTISQPYYTEGLSKLPDTGFDDLNKPPVYTPTLPAGHVSNNGLLSNQFHSGPPSSHDVMYIPDQEISPNDSQSDLWLKSGGEIPPEVAFQQYDGGLSNGYFYPEDYHPLGEDMMNMRNREYMHSPYHEVNGLPNPYALTDEDKIPQIPLHYAESHESGYSTPTSKNHRVVREIIV
ncbi:hemicentin-2-like isoform X1 [Limulus polyphemus]|uniref:Hemicentin-2-like isoform X1 n=1 Tax=Limulus polyphemus TaxID=6850 RepID=A0ABM1TAZ7_LIMPO|nr:hemicentin-2-like isoform X1 [Limulus polyphemus]